MAGEREMTDGTSEKRTRSRTTSVRTAGVGNSGAGASVVAAGKVRTSKKAAGPRRPRLLILIVAYNAEASITSVLGRIPEIPDVDVEVLVLDDASQDETFSAADRYQACRYPVVVMTNGRNQGYGGNQKIGYHYAIERGMDFVALVHGDGQYAPELLPQLLGPLLAKESDAVFGSRMMVKKDALKGGMPLYKFIGNQVLSRAQNSILGSGLTEFHSGYRLYSTAVLRKIPFGLNADDFSFDTEIIIQLLESGAIIRELPIPTHYGDEVCHVNGTLYALQVIKASIMARIQRAGLFYNPRFDVQRDRSDLYKPKLNFDSPHTKAVNAITPGARVLDLGCGRGHISQALRDKGCHVVGVDFKVDPARCDEAIEHDLNQGLPDLEGRSFDYVVMLDVIEHMNRPEILVDELKAFLGQHPETKLIVSTGNIAFAPVRLSLLLGSFNYGSRGILDMTHTRLFTEKTLKRLFQDRGFDIDWTDGLPAPFPLAVGDTALARFLLKFNRLLIKIWRSAFAYQIMIQCKPRPSLAWLLERARSTAADRRNAA